MTEPTKDSKPKTKTIALSLYEDDIAVIESLAISHFMYNDSAAARHIIRHFESCSVAKQEVERL